MLLFEGLHFHITIILAFLQRKMLRFTQLLLSSTRPVLRSSIGEIGKICACALSSSATSVKEIQRQKKVKLQPYDGNQAASYVAYHMSDTSFIYPITPSSPMGEYADEMSTHKIKNIFGQVTKIAQMQSEAGAAGTCIWSMM